MDRAIMDFHKALSDVDGGGGAFLGLLACLHCIGEKVAQDSAEVYLSGTGGRLSEAGKWRVYCDATLGTQLFV